VVHYISLPVLPAVITQPGLEWNGIVCVVYVGFMLYV
jgi:hypothetical protein